MKLTLSLFLIPFYIIFPSGVLALQSDEDALLDLCNYWRGQNPNFNDWPSNCDTSTICDGKWAGVYCDKGVVVELSGFDPNFVTFVITKRATYLTTADLSLTMPLGRWTFPS